MVKCQQVCNQLFSKIGNIYCTVIFLPLSGPRKWDTASVWIVVTRLPLGNRSWIRVLNAHMLTAVTLKIQLKLCNFEKGFSSLIVLWDSNFMLSCGLLEITPLVAQTHMTHVWTKKSYCRRKILSGCWVRHLNFYSGKDIHPSFHSSWGASLWEEICDYALHSISLNNNNRKQALVKLDCRKMKVQCFEIITKSVPFWRGVVLCNICIRVVNLLPAHTESWFNGKISGFAQCSKLYSLF